MTCVCVRGWLRLYPFGSFTVTCWSTAGGKITPSMMVSPERVSSRSFTLDPTEGASAMMVAAQPSPSTLRWWCRERGSNPRPSDVSDTTRGFARHTIAFRLPYESDALPTTPPRPNLACENPHLNNAGSNRKNLTASFIRFHLSAGVWSTSPQR